ncbi:MAG: di-heme oxidoredictase family protein [Chthoniobacterales bacterium]
METVPASGAVLVVSNAITTNPGFESGTSGWTLGSIHTVQASNARTGLSALRSHIPGGAVGAQLVKEVPAIVPGKIYTLSFWAKQISAGTGYVQQYKLEWVGSNSAVISVATGNWVNFSGGNAAYLKITTSALTAPANTATARITFYCATGAVAGSNGDLWLDDVALEFQATTIGATPAQTRQITSLTRAVMRLEWPSVAGVSYTVEQNSSLSSGGWSAASGPLAGTGANLSHRVSAEGTQKFFRVSRPIVLPAAPSNIRLVPTGIAGSISLAWDAATTPGVTGYRVLYGTSAAALDQSVELGLVQSATLPNLAPGQTYHLTVVSLSGDVAGPSGATVLSSTPESDPVFLSLFSAATPLQRDPVIETSTAKITYLADRVRDRHAREANFHLYDHYLTWYWEQRVANIEIIDRVAKGGTDITFNYTTQDLLNPAEFRTFFGGITTVAQYNNNQIAALVSTNASSTPGETDYNYSATITQNANANNRALQIGDRVEVEISYFLRSPRNGRNNYYGTTLLYVVGQGIVPWAQANDLGLPGGVVGVVNQTLDSHPLPEEALLGGRATLPYQYSNEPEHRFKQMAGNITPENGQPFMLGRRLHHTDFQTGVHSESGNPVFAEQINKVGPKFVARSCVACHVNNGRSLLPAIGATLDQAVVKVSASADGSPHPVLGEQLQPYSTNGPAEAGVVLAGFTTVNGTYGDGTSYSLRQPLLQFSGVIPPYYSLRVAPALVGLGLLEAVPESAVLALADPDDANADGISGRVHYVPDPTNSLILRLGRFTPKANQSRVVHQIAYALNRDMGVTSALFPVLDGETSPRPAEISGTDLDLFNRYVALLGVGAQRDFLDPEVVRGKQLFTSASCVACHIPSFSTSPYHPMGELRSQTIHPYTDLLLHDMGPGLADNMDEEGSTGAEWRTAPLWNIGLTAGVSGGEAYLHDGRARSIEEAILWHGGEAAAAKENFRTMPAADRAAVIRFIRSL